MKYLQLSLFALLVFLSGCISYDQLDAARHRGAESFPPQSLADAVTERRAVLATPDTATVQVAAPGLPEKIHPQSYIIGPGDGLLINIDGKSDLSSSGQLGKAGSRVDALGRVSLPLVGRVNVSGKNLSQIEDQLARVFARYLNDPWVVVEISRYRSYPLYLLGQFKNAGTFYLDRPHSLLAGLALGGGMQDTANLESARLIRENRTLPVDLFRLLHEGDLSQNITLLPGDTIFVPDVKNQKVFVFGAVSKFGPVSMPNGHLSLSQALAAAGLVETRGRTGQIRIIRSLTPTRGELLTVDHNLIMQGKALPFPLEQGDIVYVPPSAIGSWNQVIRDILPSLQLFSSMLQPFIAIKYLQDD